MHRQGMACKPYEFGVEAGIAVTARRGLIVDARSFPSNPYDGDTLAEQLEQARTLIQGAWVYWGRDVDCVQLLHLGTAKSLTRRQWRWTKRRQAVEPVIGTSEAGTSAVSLLAQRPQGDALNAIGAAADYNCAG